MFAQNYFNKMALSKNFGDLHSGKQCSEEQCGPYGLGRVTFFYLTTNDCINY